MSDLMCYCQSVPSFSGSSAKVNIYFANRFIGITLGMSNLLQDKDYAARRNALYIPLAFLLSVL